MICNIYYDMQMSKIFYLAKVLTEISKSRSKNVFFSFNDPEENSGGVCCNVKFPTFPIREMNSKEAAEELVNKYT